MTKTPELFFFIIFLATIVVVRIFLYFRPTPGPTIRGFRTHHYMYGILLALVGMLLKNIPAYAIGLGLFIDELGYLFIGGKTHKDNYSKTSLLLLAAFIVLVYFLKGIVT